VTLIVVLSVAFIGNAVHSLQEAGYIGATSLISALPRLPNIVAQFTGFHPTVETIAAQLLLVAVYVAAWIVVQIRQRRMQPVPTQRAASA
jgi:high-affinity iron transporter